MTTPEPNRAAAEREAASRPIYDQAEVERFGRIADDWWNPSGQFAPLHAIGPLRTGFIRRSAELTLGVSTTSVRPFTGMTALDVGCGGGLVAEPLARLGAVVTAIDPAPESIAVATLHARQHGLTIDYRCDRLETIVAAGQTFDLVTCLEVLEHIPDPAAFLQLLGAVVRPGGLLVLSTLNRTAASFALAIVGAEYVLGWVPRGTHQWDRFIRPADLDRWCEAAGLTPLGAEGIVFNPLSGSWRLSADTSVNYMAAAVRR